MAHSIPTRFSLFVLGLFDSEFIIDYTSLAHDYPALYEGLHTPLPTGDAWEVIPKSDERKLVFAATEYEGGTKYRPDAVMKAMFKATIEITPDLEQATQDLLSEPVRYHDINVYHYPYGIGIFNGWIDIALEDGLTSKAVEKVIREIADAVATSEGLHVDIRAYDRAITTRWNTVQKQLDLPAPVFSHDQISRSEQATILWTHGVSVFDIETGFTQESPFGEESRNLTGVGHPDGLVNMCSTSVGFVHIGWGLSFMAGVLPEEQFLSLSALQRAQYDWLAADQFSQLLTRNLDGFASLPGYSNKDLKDMMAWIDRVQVEMELYETHRSMHLQMLNRHSYQVYQNIERGWRMPQQIEGYDRKLRSLSMLYGQAENRLTQHQQDRLNRWVAVITFLALIGAVNDGLSLAWPDYASYIPPGIGLLILALLCVLIAVLYIVTFREQ